MFTSAQRTIRSGAGLLPLLFALGVTLTSCDIGPIDPSEVVTLSGVIVDVLGDPVAGASVVTIPATMVATTAADGSYALTNVAGGYYTLRATRDGYKPVTLDNVAARGSRPADRLVMLDSFPHTGLVGYYRMNATASDASGRGNHGSAVSTVMTSDRFGDLGGAMLFDGTASRFTVPSTSSMNFALPRGFSIAAWVRFGDLQTQQPGVVAKGSGGAHLVGYELRINAGKAEAEVGTTLGPASTRAERFINDNRWHLIGLVASRQKSRLEFYMDGDMVDFTPSTLLLGDVASSASLMIGRGAVTGAGFSGAIDDVRLYHRELTDDDFALLYHERGF